MSRLPIVVLLSGYGSTLQSLLDRVAAGELDVELRAVLSDRAGAYGLERARLAGLATAVVDWQAARDRDEHDALLTARVAGFEPQLVVLAGFMRLLGRRFLERYAGAAINIHPSLLPRHPGLDTYARALAAGDREHGSSVHFVTAELDGGPLIAQTRVAVRAGDDVERLKTRVQAEERRLYPTVIQWFAEGRVQLTDGRVLLDGQPLTAPVLFDEHGEQ